MKVHRAKRLSRLLAFYRNNYSLAPPYHLLIDGTFCTAALREQIAIRDQLHSYLGTQVFLLTTDCVVGTSRICCIFAQYLCAFCVQRRWNV